MSGILSGEEERSVSSPGAQCRGHVDVVSHLLISGWVFNPVKTEQVVGIAVNGVPMASLPAAEYRADVQEAGFGDGRAGFAIMLPPNTFQEGSFFVTLYEAETKEVLVNGALTLKDGRRQSIDFEDVEKLTVSQFLDCYYNIRGMNDIGLMATKISRIVKRLSPIEALSIIYFLILKRAPDTDAIDRLKRTPPTLGSYRKTAESLMSSAEFQQGYKLRSVWERLESFSIPALLKRS